MAKQNLPFPKGISSLWKSVGHIVGTYGLWLDNQTRGLWLVLTQHAAKDEVQLLTFVSTSQLLG